MKSELNLNQSNKAIIIGATSGIGLEFAKILIRQGWVVGLAGRRIHELNTLKNLAPDRIFVEAIDIQKENASLLMKKLISMVGGMDLYFHSSGIGKQNRQLESEIEIDTLRTNGEGFVRMITTAFHYFREQGYGHIAVISSIAGTKGIGAAPAYSATKRMQNTYMEALEQLAMSQKLCIKFTDIRPGFVRTPLLNDGFHYPMMLEAEKVASMIYTAIKRRQRIAVIDWKYSLLVWIWKFLPGWIWRRIKL